FKVIEGKENDFIKVWSDLTNLIYEFEGSYGSRLHKSNNQTFIAYAQWPDKETWENSGSNLPDIANNLRKQMKECCSEIKTEYQLNIVQDLLKDKKHDK
ncbi:MAG: antibiotic biosynthesis monooxygenase family protein, partial [Candidatus Sericytochromatia bacterium]